MIGAVNASARAPRTSSSAPPAACPAICTSCGARASRTPITSSTATRAWATRSPAASASRWPIRRATCYVMVGDGSYLMMAQEIVTSIQEGFKLIDRAARQPGLREHRRRCRARSDPAASARAIGIAIRARRAHRRAAAGRSRGQCRVARRRWCIARPIAPSLDAALRRPRAAPIGPRSIYVPIDPARGVPGYESWWDVAVAEVSEQDSVREARKAWEAGKKRERWFP